MRSIVAASHGAFGVLALWWLLAACAAFNPAPAPAATNTAGPAATHTAPTPTASAAHVAAQARYGTIPLEPVQNSGVSGSLTAKDNGDGTTLLSVRLDGGSDLNPWGLYTLADCKTPVPDNARPLLFLPDIDNGHKEETVETAAYKFAPGNLVVIVTGAGANGIPAVVACADLGPADTSVAQVTAAATEECRAANATGTPAPLDGDWLAYSASPNNNGDIYIVRVDEQRANPATVKRLTTHPAADFDPMWSPDGRRIAFRSQRDGNDEIYVMNADGTCQVNLTHDPRNDWSPAWSADGLRIAFAKFFDDKPYTDIALMNLDGSALQRLTNMHGEYPAWSPDGRRIAFASARDGNYEIYVMNADGSGQTRLTTNPAYDMAPAWSPDGMRIAYDTQRDHTPPKEVGIGPEFEIHVMNADGSGDVQMTNNAQEDRFPAWAPNRHIAFARDGAIFAMNPDGSGQVPLGLNGSFPAWRPLSRALP